MDGTVSIGISLSDGIDGSSRLYAERDSLEYDILVSNTSQAPVSVIQEVLQGFEDSNLFTSDLELNGAQNMVADAANTVFTLDAGGREVTVSVYALGMVIIAATVVTSKPGRRSRRGVATSAGQSAVARIPWTFSSLLRLAFNDISACFDAP
jgi:hypothetical protein